MNKKVVVFITSVIYYKNKSLSYSNVRSVFSSDNRAIQTIKTIHSIRKMIPDAKIVFCELGLKRDLPFEIERMVDKYVYLGEKRVVRLAVDSSNKSLGELLGLIFLKKILFKTESDFFIKISGRYFLNENFNLNMFLRDGFVFKKYGNSLSTRLYGFSGRYMNCWFLVLLKSLVIVLFGVSIEDALIKFVPNKYINYVDQLGVSGFVAPDGKPLEE